MTIPDVVASFVMYTVLGTKQPQKSEITSHSSRPVTLSGVSPSAVRRGRLNSSLHLSMSNFGFYLFHEGVDS